MSVSLSNLHNQVIDYLKQGKFAENIEDFYTEDATAQENSNPPTVGRTTMANNERPFEKKIRKYLSIEIRATPLDLHGGGNRVIFYETIIHWTSKQYGPQNNERGRG